MKPKNQFYLKIALILVIAFLFIGVAQGSTITPVLIWNSSDIGYVRSIVVDDVESQSSRGFICRL